MKKDFYISYVKLCKKKKFFFIVNKHNNARWNSSDLQVNAEQK